MEYLGPITFILGAGLFGWALSVQVRIKAAALEIADSLEAAGHPHEARRVRRAFGE